MIPKKIHFIWIGDESKIPFGCINTWMEKNRGYLINLWTNQSLHPDKWENWDKIQDMLDKKDYAGAADIMRYEILYKEGGIYIDADSYCVKPLEDWLLDCEAFASWEQEVIRNNLISNGFIGGEVGAPFWRLCIDEVKKLDCKEDKLAWLITGPMMLSNLYFTNHCNLTIYPSHYFLPEHHTGYKTKTTGNNFANHLWGSEIGYDDMDRRVK